VSRLLSAPFAPSHAHKADVWRARLVRGCVCRRRRPAARAADDGVRDRRRLLLLSKFTPVRAVAAREPAAWSVSASRRSRWRHARVSETRGADGDVDGDRGVFRRPRRRPLGGRRRHRRVGRRRNALDPVRGANSSRGSALSRLYDGSASSNVGASARRRSSVSPLSRNIVAAIECSSRRMPRTMCTIPID